MRSPCAKRWVFTINNFSYDEHIIVQNLKDNENIEYIIAEMEHLDDGTPHIQGFLKTKDKKRRNQIEGLLGGRAFVEVANGTDVQNINYCKKENQVIVESGNFVGVSRGASIKTDEDAKIMLEDIKTMNEDEFEAAHPKFYLMNRQKYKEFHHEYMVRQQKVYDGNLKKKNIWIWGPPGTGKSRCSRIGVEQYQIFSKSFNKWWNGYDPCNTKRIVIDDWPSKENGGAILAQHLKIWADRYPFTGETKGGHIAIAPQYQLIITSNYSIERCFTTEEDIEAIRRRFTEIYWTETRETMNPYEAYELSDLLIEND